MSPVQSISRTHNDLLKINDIALKNTDILSNKSLNSEAKQPASYLTQNSAAITPPDDNIGDVTPLSLFSLLEGDNFYQDIDKINNIVQRINLSDYIQTKNCKILIFNKIPTGIIKI